MDGRLISETTTLDTNERHQLVRATVKRLRSRSSKNLNYPSIQPNSGKLAVRRHGPC